MYRQLSLSFPLLLVLSCRDVPDEDVPRAVALSCGESWSQQLGPLDVWLPPNHTVTGVVDLTQPGYEATLAWVRSQAAEELAYDCPAGELIVHGHTAESAYADGDLCLASYSGVLTGTCTCSDPTEVCTGGGDEDGDGLIDCEDPDCAAASSCQPPPWRCSGGDACEADGRTLTESDPACADPEKLFVCAVDAWCCTYEWDSSCAAQAEANGWCDEQPDAGVDLDAPVDMDAGMPDAGVPDAGMPDAGVPDAGMPDAGMPDAGVPDAGMPDAIIMVPHPSFEQVRL